MKTKTVSTSVLKTVFKKEVSRMTKRVKTLAREVRDYRMAVKESEKDLKLGKAELIDATQLLSKARTSYMQSTLRECVVDTKDELRNHREDLRDNKANLKEVEAELKRAVAELERMTS